MIAIVLIALLAACNNTTNPGQGAVTPPGNPHEDSNEIRNPDIDTNELNNPESGDPERGVGAGR